jgi:hypothetical protein
MPILTKIHDFGEFFMQEGMPGPIPIVESPYLVGSDQNLNWFIFVADRFRNFERSWAVPKLIPRGGISYCVLEVPMDGVSFHTFESQLATLYMSLKCSTILTDVLQLQFMGLAPRQTTMYEGTLK